MHKTNFSFENTGHLAELTDQWQITDVLKIMCCNWSVTGPSARVTVCVCVCVCVGVCVCVWKRERGGCESACMRVCVSVSVFVSPRLWQDFITKTRTQECHIGQKEIIVDMWPKPLHRFHLTGTINEKKDTYLYSFISFFSVFQLLMYIRVVTNYHVFLLFTYEPLLSSLHV